jgi:hypothetical protein
MPKALTKEDFITRATEIHNNKYDYTNINYVRQTETIIITCPAHGEFEQRPSNHIYGKGCYKCGREVAGKKNSDSYTKDTEFFIKKAIAVHGNRYDYSLVDYTDMKTSVTIVCASHGSFLQNPHTHTIIKSGCPKCASAGRSRLQDEWLDKLEKEVGEITRNSRIYFSDGSWLRPDGFKDNTFYEFWGDWAHGNPKFYPPNEYNALFKKTYGQLYEETLTKRDKILKNGFKLIEIWEHEWKL